jgi:hypothetical protein
MINYLTEAIEYQTADDIYLLPREEFTPYVSKCKGKIADAAIPFAVLVLLHEEKNSLSYRLRHLFSRAG